MTKAYLTCLPRKFIRAMAGFTKIGTYYLRRAGVKPPESLRLQIFPDVDGWLARFGERFGPRRANWNQGGVDEDDMAGQGFLRLLDQLRNVILQDAAILQNECPKSPFFIHPLFDTAEWRRFADLVLEAEREEETPMSLQIQSIVPVVAEAMHTSQQYLAGRINYWGHSLAQSLDGIQGQLSDLMGGKIPLYFGAPPGAFSAGPLAAAVAPLSAAPRLPTINEIPPATIATYPSVPAALTAPLTAPADLCPVANRRFFYQMSAEVQTVPDIWREWTQGVGGGPSIEFLDATFKKPPWKQTQAQKMWHSRRKPLYLMIKARVEAGEQADAVTGELEALRRRLKKQMNGFLAYIKEQMREA